jgi:predicted transcriptional regulator
MANVHDTEPRGVLPHHAHDAWRRPRSGGIINSCSGAVNANRPPDEVPDETVPHRVCGIVVHMKAVQITLDDALLARLDADEEVRRDGRSAVLRRAADEYLRKRRKRAIADQYANAYGAVGNIGGEFTGWEDEGVWPGR